MSDTNPPVGDPRFPYSGVVQPTPRPPAVPPQRTPSGPPMPPPLTPAPPLVQPGEDDQVRLGQVPVTPGVNASQRPTQKWFSTLSVVLFVLGLFLTIFGISAMNRARDIAATSLTSPVSPSSFSPSPIPGGLSETELQFGQTAQWSDGLEVTVSAPTEIGWADEADREYYSLPGHTPIEFDVEVVNGTTETVESISFMASVISDSEQGDELLRCSDNKFSPPSAPIRSGNSLKYKACFQVKNPSDVELTWSGTYDRDSVSFSSQ